MLPIPFLLLLALPGEPLEKGAGEPPVARYEIDLSDPSDDLFHVTFRPARLSAEDARLDFVGFAPGVHSLLNFGRFVQEIRALDSSGEEVAIERTGTNSWELSDPTRVERILYTIEDTFDAQVEGDSVVPCGGSGIEDDYVLLNPFAVLPYFAGHLQGPVELVIKHDPEWVVGTALELDSDGVYRAPSYRFLADSPFLMGDLSTTAIPVGDIDVDIFVHSPVASINAQEVLFVVGDALEAAGRFIGFAPVDRYVLLLDFIGRDSMIRNRFRSLGALEHSYSSLYTLPPAAGDGLAGVIAHEFMHILTPLHLKSRIIAEFDYSIPTTDKHLWLYEGITEWSAHMLRLRGGLTDLEEHLGVLAQKMRMASRFDPEFGLMRMSLEWFEGEGPRQYGNVYQLGALTGSMLDIRLLQLSGGKRGLREVFFEFCRRYGPERPFDADTFFDELVEATYPEIEGFIEAHILGNEPLPYGELFAAVGIAHNPNGRTLSLIEDCTDEQLALREAWTAEVGE